MEPTPIQILLACYNGEKFIAEQLDSLLSQSMQDFEILIRDDGSSDKTLGIVKEYQERFPKKIRIMTSNTRLGVVGNFNALLEASTADYLLFSDQDDVWLKDKVKLTFEALKKGEDQHGKMMPLLVHTDLAVVDSKKKMINPSFWKFSKLDPIQGQLLNRLLVQNVVTGCTMGINRALADIGASIPNQAIMHDWWLALTATLKGHVIALNESTILYRQHANNTLGAKAPSLKQKVLKGLWLLFISTVSLPEIKKLESQTTCLFERFKDQCTPEAKDMLTAYLKSPEMTKFQRKWAFLKYRFFRSGVGRNIAYLFQERPF